MGVNQDLLPPCVNEFLDKFEAGLCLPIIIIIIFCTVQFIISHIMDIVCTVMYAVNGSPDDADMDECTFIYYYLLLLS